MSEAAQLQSAQAPAFMPQRRRHTWLFAVLALLLVGIGIALGNWQLRRAAQKEALQAQIDVRSRLPVLEQPDFLALSHPIGVVHRRVQLRGLWLGSQTVYLDNRQMGGVPGFYVLTPLALEGSNDTVMVQRGWIQRNFNDRAQLAPVETPSGLVEIQAVVAPPPAHLLELGKEAAAAPAGPGNGDAAAPAPAAPGAVGSSPIRQNLDLEVFRTQSGLPLRTDFSLQEIGSASQGLQRDWPAPALGIDRHYGYAFQWFGLSALVAVLYVWFQLIVPFRRARRSRHG